MSIKKYTVWLKQKMIWSTDDQMLADIYMEQMCEEYAGSDMYMSVAS